MLLMYVLKMVNYLLFDVKKNLFYIYKGKFCLLNKMKEMSN